MSTGGGKGKNDSAKELRRAHVLALAHALEMYKTLSGDRVAGVIKGVQGTMIDGRPYLRTEITALPKFQFR